MLKHVRIGLIAALLLAGGSASAQEKADSHVDFHMNAAGVLQLGLTPTIEFGGMVSGLARVRVMNTGLLSYVMLADLSDDETFKFGLGVGGGARFYPAGRGRMVGPYVGGGAEWVTTTVEDTSVDNERYQTQGIVPQAEGGYRWAFRSGMLLGVGAVGGVFLPIKATTQDLTTKVTRDRDESATFYGMVVFDIGFFL